MQATSVRQRDPAHDVLRIERRPLDALFAPQSVAVIGASETPGSVDRALVGNLTQGAPRHQVFVVNPHHASIFGLPAYPTIGAVPAAVDLAVIATPAETVSQALAQCIEAGVRAAIVISAGFKESGPEGAARAGADDPAAPPNGQAASAADRSQLLRRDVPVHGPQRDLCARAGAAGQRRVHLLVPISYSRGARSVCAGETFHGTPHCCVVTSSLSVASPFR